MCVLGDRQSLGLDLNLNVLGLSSGAFRNDDDPLLSRWYSWTQTFNFQFLQIFENPVHVIPNAGDIGLQTFEPFFRHQKRHVTRHRARGP